MRTLTSLSLTLALLLGGGAAFAEAKPTYDKLCASCHGADGKGNAEKAKLLKIDPKILDFSRPEAKFTRDELREILLKGKAKMPAYAKKLAAAEVDPMTDYVIALTAAARGK